MVIGALRFGFFSNLNCVLSNLRWRLGRRGVRAAIVDWRVDPSWVDFAYGRPEDGNTWLHFFEPLAFDSVPAETVRVESFARLDITAVYAYATYKLSRDWRQKYSELYRRHIRVRPAILAKVDRIQSAEMAGRYCLGVHYRHPAHAIECLHPIPTPDVFIAQARKLLPANRPWAVVLATDVESAVGEFRRAFGDNLVIQPEVARAGDADEEMVHHRPAAPRLVLGEQVLVDCLLLSRCDALLHVTSNIATAVGYMNPSIKMVYCETPAQAAWGYVWSACFGVTGLAAFFGTYLPNASRNAERRTRRFIRSFTR